MWYVTSLAGSLFGLAGNDLFIYLVLVQGPAPIDDRKGRLLCSQLQLREQQGWHMAVCGREAWGGTLNDGLDFQCVLVEQGLYARLMLSLLQGLAKAVICEVNAT